MFQRHRLAHKIGGPGYSPSISSVASNGGGAITANSRTTDDSTWYVIDHSTVRFYLMSSTRYLNETDLDISIFDRSLQLLDIP